MTTIRFVDFHLTVDGVPGGYTVEARGPEGSGPGPEPFRLEEDEAFARTARQVQEGERPPLAALQALGARLFDALFPRNTLYAYMAADKALPPGTRLRLKLNVRPMALARLPWEALYDPFQRVFLVGSRDQPPLVRTLDTMLPHPPFTLSGRLRVLHVQANPRGSEALALAGSAAALAQALGDWAEMVTLTRPTAERLREALRGTFHVLHYDGHAALDEAEGQGYLLLHDEEDNLCPLSAEMLGNYLAGTTVQLAVLAGCETGSVGEVNRFIALPAVVAMQYRVPDEAAIAFTRGFYGALRGRQPVEVALADARLAMREQNEDASWLAPVLYLRVREGHLFEQAATGAAQASTSYQATLIGDGGSIVQGPGALSVGKGGTVIQGDVSGNLTLGRGGHEGDSHDG